MHPPAVYRGGVTDFIIVSTSYMHDGLVNETYVFPASDTGEIIDYEEIDGSYQGGTDHDEALRRAGYTLLDLDGPVDTKTAAIVLEEEP